MDTNQIIIALDFPNADQALGLVDQLDPNQCRVKVGKELFTRTGPEIVKTLTKMGFDVFLDLKFHDIPNTVANACLAAADLGAWMVNVHASGGRTMMETAKQKIENYEIKLIAVTVLTSLDQADLAEVGLDIAPQKQVVRLANLTQDAGLDGVVCSPLEITTLREKLDDSFDLVTPGIRPAGSATGDQKRMMTPKQAIEAGSNWLVIGRPITAAPSPIAALQDIYTELAA